MKKTIQIIVLAALCLFLSSAARAQMTPLKIGDLVPDITINNIINYKTTSAKLSDFKGKLLILDFWATWCAPCVSMIPRMDSLQKQFDSKIQFLSITSQNAAVVESFRTKLQKQKNAVYSLPEVLEDKTLRGMFPHSTLPHYVWIDQRGVVREITEFKEVNAQNIEKFLLEGNLEAAV